MKKQIRNLLFWCSLSVSVLSGCYYDKEDQLYPNSQNNTSDTLTVVTYSGQIRDLVSGSCATSTACHAAGAANTDLSTYAGLYASRTNVKTRINLDASSGSYMPKGSALSATDKSRFNKWLDAGALNN